MPLFDAGEDDDGDDAASLFLILAEARHFFNHFVVKLGSIRFGGYFCLDLEYLRAHFHGDQWICHDVVIPIGGVGAPALEAKIISCSPSPK